MFVSDDAGKLKLNLGCGMHKREGYVNVDQSPVCQPDVVLDLERTPWPWPDDAVDAVQLIHVLEHLGQQPHVFLAIMKELWRVCGDGATIHIEVPHPRSDEFLGDPTHVRAVTADGLDLFSQRKCAEYARTGAANTPLGKYLGVDFEIVSTTLVPKAEWLERWQRGEVSEADLRAAGNSQWNVYAGIQIILQAIKPAGRLVVAPAADGGELTAQKGSARKLIEQGRLDEARRVLDEICAATPRDVEAQAMLAACLHVGDDLDGARSHYQAAIEAGGRSFDLFNNLGVVCLDLGEAAQAVSHFQSALEQAPGDRLVRLNLAEAKAAAGAVRDAIDMFTALIQEQQDDAATYVALAKMFVDQGWYADADNALAMARQFGADSLDLINQEGIVRRERFRYAEALERFETALANAPGSIALQVSRANVLGWLRQDAAADEAYRQALAAAPDDTEARFAYACFLLMRGRTDPGWAHYEARWQRRDVLRTRRTWPALPQWQGEATDPDRDVLLVHSEQGFGDNLQFVRLLQRIAPLFKHIILVTRPALAPLLRRSLADVAEVVTEVPAAAVCRWQVPLVSIAHALKLPVAQWTMPAPYLWPDTVKKAIWQTYLPDDGRKRIGICWSGGKRPRYRHRFDLPLEAVDALLGQDGFAWVSLQHAGFEDWRLERQAKGRFVDPMALVRDFDDTAALLSGLDLVISTDTAVAHLAGAMGKPVWLLLSSEGEWRWLQDRADTPWYPTMRIFRQTTPGDWAAVAAAVIEALPEAVK
jgi:Tfp pilus assembly protein PilF